MAIKTFTTGEVLTASDTNTYLANSGLVYVTSATVGTAVSSVTISNCFSSTYDNYKIMLSGGTASASTDVQIQLGSSTTGYYGVLVYLTVGGTVSQASVNNGSSMFWVGGATAGQAVTANFEIMNPYLAQWTKIRNGSYENGNNFGTLQGNHQVATSYASFTLLAGTGTLTGGTVTVYGYRRA